MSSTREAQKSRRQAAGQQQVDQINAAISGKGNILGDHNRAMHIGGNVYVTLHAPGEQLSDVERVIVASYRVASRRAQNTIRNVALQAAANKREA